ncbi:MAG: PQQ-dependent sugar dehydrogenase [Gemmatimonadota bacterium]|nr:PQQ-dependent sugar dehydrogenase [Gemmatimonadota bacterium]MDH3427382.1 PQQ-dependent sugar dehydrogenase [Gemmatimonadota bacterium]
MTRVLKLCRLVPMLLGLPVISCATDAPGSPGTNVGPDPDSAAQDLVLTQIAGGLQRPVHLTAPDGDDRLFIVEKIGRVRIVEQGLLLPTPFLDLTGSVSGGNEQGLLSLAFHPNFASNGQIFVDYTDAGGTTRVERYELTADPNVADPTSGQLLLLIPQPFSHHNGGHILFGPDGMLYVASGDGGTAGAAQDRTTRLGSVLRIDVDSGSPFAIPPDNPFVGHGTFLPEIWLWGVRNPWRIAFDRTSGDLYVADVGQSRWEEVTVVGPGDGGANLGWNVVEAGDCVGNAVCDPTEFTLPQIAYDHGDGCSITGGHVYRGGIEELRGVYFYSDYCGGWLRSFRLAGGQATEHAQWDVASAGNVTSFGEDGAGELYVLTENAVFRIDEVSP